MAKLAGLLIIVLLALVVGVLGTFEFMTRFAPQPNTKITNRTFVVEETKMTEKVIYATQGAHTSVSGEEVKFRIPVFNTPILPSSRTAYVYGECDAGVDFQAHKPKIDYNKDRTEVTITVEEPVVFGCRVGPGDIVLSDNGGIVPASSELTNQLLVVAMPKLEDYALQKNLLENARRSEEEKLDHLARQFGFTEVKIVFIQPSEPED